MTSLLNKIRVLIDDYSSSVKDIFTYENSNLFKLSESNVITVSDVLVNDVSSSITYVYDSTKKTITITSSLSSGDIVEIDYTCYQKYSDTELTGYIQAALLYLSINNYYNFEYDSETDDIYPELEDREENLVALIASIIINKPINTYRLPDITITYPNDLPLNEKIAKTIAVFKKNSSGIFSIL